MNESVVAGGPLSRSNSAGESGRMLLVRKSGLVRGPVLSSNFCCQIVTSRARRCSHCSDVYSGVLSGPSRSRISRARSAKM